MKGNVKWDGGINQLKNNRVNVSMMNVMEAIMIGSSITGTAVAMNLVTGI